MLNDETKRKLRELNIGEIIEGVDYQDKNGSYILLTFDERLQHLVDYLYQEKYNNKIQRLIKAATFRFPQADFHSIYYENRSISREAINELLTGQFIKSNKSVVFQGYTGSGKTYLACAIGKSACLDQIRTKYIRLPDLLIEFGDAVLGGKTKEMRIINKYAKFPLLIIDEWLMADLSKEEIRFLFELMERRSDAASTIFCTQYSKKDWIKKLGEDVYAEAIVDRYSYNTIWIETGKTNMREYCANIDE